MIDTLVIVVYDRLYNLERWFHIIKLSTRPKNVVVIHNGEGAEYRELCEANDAIYIKRPNVGFDIGAFQDVCRDRLKDFPKWSQLLWVTDDTFPMVENYLDYFALKDSEGVRCMELSPYVKKHIRTTGFSIKYEVAKNIQFQADPITTKAQCYMFEHLSKMNKFIDQVHMMGFQVVMVAPRETSPMFDTGYHRRQPREKELSNKWGINIDIPVPSGPMVTVICPVFNPIFPEIISSMLCQTFKDWELLLIHDGPNNNGLQNIVHTVNDDRIQYIESPKHLGNWGHSYRSEYIHKAKGKFILITNADNHHTPVYLEYMLKGFANDSIIATYCDTMVHSYKAWQVIPCSLQRGFLDCAGVLVRADAAKSVGWNNITYHSSDWLYFSDLINKYGEHSFAKVIGCLLIHN